MRLVVADTGPLNYLVLIREIGLLATLFEKIFVPEAVIAELLHEAAPPVVRAWAGSPPAWVEVMPVSSLIDDPAWQALDSGERAALALAHDLSADLVLIDDRAAAAVAIQHGFEVTGTLGVLDLAARTGLVDFAFVIQSLKATTFRYRPAFLDSLLAQHQKNED